MKQENSFASAGLTASQLDTIVKKFGGHHVAPRLLHEELLVYEPPCSWRERDGVIYFSVTSDGTTGREWITRLKDKGFRLGLSAEEVLRSPDFNPTSGVTTEVAVLKGTLFEYNNRITKKIRAEADKRKLSKPNAELACLIREKFTDKEIEAMGLSHIVAMHEPIKDSESIPLLLTSACRGITVFSGYSEHDWNDNIYSYSVPVVQDYPEYQGELIVDIGFAFAVSVYRYT